MNVILRSVPEIKCGDYLLIDSSDDKGASPVFAFKVTAIDDRPDTRIFWGGDNGNKITGDENAWLVEASVEDKLLIVNMKKMFPPRKQ